MLADNHRIINAMSSSSSTTTPVTSSLSERAAVEGRISSDDLITDPFGDGRDPQKVLVTLKKLLPMKDPGNSHTHPKIPKTYEWWCPKYSQNKTGQMTEAQRNTVVNIWKKFSRDMITFVDGEVSKEEDPVAGSTHYTKNDKARILHARAEPAFIALWTRALGPITHRPTLDAKQSHKDDDSEAAYDPWIQLAVAINNHDGDFQPQNPAVVYDRRVTSTNAEVFIKTNTYIGTVATETIISETFCQQINDINPNESDRPPMTGDFVKRAWKDFVKNVTVAFSNFNRSGSQNGNFDTRNGLDEWLSYCTGNQLTTYAALILDETDLHALNKELEEGLESGLIGENIATRNSCNNKATPSIPAKSCLGKRGGHILKKSETQNARRAKRRAMSPGEMSSLSADDENNNTDDDEDESIASSISQQTKSTALIALLQSTKSTSKNYGKIKKALAASAGVELSDSDSES